MLLNIRPIPFVYYRLIFLSLLTMTGFLCLGTVLVAELLGIRLITTSTQVQYEALHLSLTIVGTTCFIFVTTVLYLMQDRRHIVEDRRQRELPIEFPDRRFAATRRC